MIHNIHNDVLSAAVEGGDRSDQGQGFSIKHEYLRDYKHELKKKTVCSLGLKESGSNRRDFPAEMEGALCRRRTVGSGAERMES